MAILWCGGEDIDFGASGSLPGTSTTSGEFRSTYARCAVKNSQTNNVNFRSLTFPGGAVTSCWLSYQLDHAAQATSFKHIGLRDSVTGGCLILGTSSSSATKLALYTYDGTNVAQLAAESGTSLLNTAIMTFVMQVINYGATSTVNVWANGNLVITFSGDCTVLSASSLNSVVLCGNTTWQYQVSEIIVADADTRSFLGLMTLGLTGAGDANAWTNTTFSNINGTTFSDTNPTNSNTTGQDNEYNVTDLPAGTFQIVAVKETIRAAVSATPAVTKIKMGYKATGGAGPSFTATVSTKTPATTYGSFEQLDAINPITGVAFVQSEMNALQLAFESLT